MGLRGRIGTQDEGESPLDSNDRCLHVRKLCGICCTAICQFFIPLYFVRVQRLVQEQEGCV